mmetsp:Transcript_5439/g.16206  ORF Transcript_5439/g.16206 Transcript_5439/m.16206 type:complete len:239 (+) Transcript_5439:246-962(+)
MRHAFRSNLFHLVQDEFLDCVLDSLGRKHLVTKLRDFAQDGLVALLDVRHLILRHGVPEAAVHAAVHEDKVAGVVKPPPALWHDVVDVVHFLQASLPAHLHLLGHVSGATGVGLEEVLEVVVLVVAWLHELELVLDLLREAARGHRVLAHVPVVSARTEVDRGNVDVLLGFEGLELGCNLVEARLLALGDAVVRHVLEVVAERRVDRLVTPVLGLGEVHGKSRLGIAFRALRDGVVRA